MRTETLLEKLKSYHIFDYDFKLVLMLIALSTIGVMAVGSADPSYKKKQIIGIVLGVFMMIFISLLDYIFICKFYVIYYILNLFVLGLVFTPLGHSVKGATRWITVLGVQFQPSEASKILLILFFSAFIMKYKDKVKKIYFIFLCFVFLIPPLFMIVMQPDLSTTIMLTVIVSGILFSAGINMKFVVTVLCISIPTALLVIFDALADKSVILRDYQQKRVLAWLHPEDFASSDSDPKYCSA